MRYKPELDGLRAVAVVAVVLFHSAPFGMFSGGFVGVDVFFVLSAFLITGVLHDNPSLGRFYWRRFIRLMPALLFLLASYIVAAPLIWPAYPHGRDALLAGLYLSDYSYTFWRLPLYLQHTWSLAVEEHFYLLWPLALPFLLKSRQPLFWLIAAWLAATLWRTSFADDWLTYYYRFDTHLSGLILGAALYFAKPKLNQLWAWTGFVMLATILVTAKIDLAFIAIPFAEASAALIIATPPRLLAAPALVWLGKRSYAIYLWHFPIAYAVRQDLGFAATASLTLASSIAIAAISYVTIEALGRRLKDIKCARAFHTCIGYPIRQTRP